MSAGDLVTMIEDRVIGKVRRGAIYSWMVIFSIMVLLMLHKEFDGEDISYSLYYQVFGSWTFPIFYAFYIYVMYQYVRSLKFSDRYIRFDDNILIIGTKWSVMREDISSVTLKRNFLGLKELQIRTKSGKVKRLRAYFLKTPAEQVLADLNDWASA